MPTPKSWITKHLFIFENMPTKNAYITNRRLFENAFEIATKNKFQQYCEDPLNKFKNKLSTYMVKRQKTKSAKEE